MKKIGFFIGCEGYVNNAKVLIKSILENTALSDTYELYAVMPEHLNIFLDIQRVYNINVEVPESYRAIPFIDKMLAAAKFEELCEEGYIWLDVGSCFLKTSDFSGCGEVCVNPVDMRNIGDVYGEKQSEIWEIVFSYFGLGEVSSYVLTSVTKEKIYPYYNAGMIVVNKQRELFKHIEQCIYKLLDNKRIKKIIKESSMYRVFIHQVIFSCCLIKLYGEKIKPLPYGVNYPLHLHDQNPKPIELKDIISIRYEDYFGINSDIIAWQNVLGSEIEGLRSYWYYDNKG